MLNERTTPSSIQPSHRVYPHHSQGKRAMEAAGRYMADSAKKIRSAVKETKENGPEQASSC